MKDNCGWPPEARCCSPEMVGMISQDGAAVPEAPAEEDQAECSFRGSSQAGDPDKPGRDADQAGDRTEALEGIRS